MASAEELLVSLDIYEQTKSNLLKKGYDKMRDSLIEAGCEDVFVKNLAKEDLIRYCLIEKGCIKGVLPKKPAQAVSARETGAGSMETLLQMMQMQMQQQALALEQHRADAKIAQEQAKADAKARDEAQAKLLGHMSKPWE